MGDICDTSKLQQKRTFFNEVNESNENKVFFNFGEQYYKTKVKLEFSIEGLEIGHRYQIQVQSFENVRNNLL